MRKVALSGGCGSERGHVSRITCQRQVLLVIGAEGVHPVPSRTRQLSPPAPMVLGAQAPGRVGHRQENLFLIPTETGCGGFCLRLFHGTAAGKTHHTPFQ